MGHYSKPEPISRTHMVDDFDCGVDAETFWLRSHALQAEGQTSRTYVVRRLDDDAVVGYYAIATGSVMPASATPA